MKQLFLYGVNGAINTAVTYVLFVALSNVVDYRIAIPITYALGVCLSYYLNRATVFKTYGRFWWFATVSVGLMLLNLAVTWWLVDAFGWYKEVAQIPAILAAFVLGFVVNKYFVFSHKRTRILTTKS